MHLLKLQEKKVHLLEKENRLYSARGLPINKYNALKLKISLQNFFLRYSFVGMIYNIVDYATGEIPATVQGILDFEITIEIPKDVPVKAPDGSDSLGLIAALYTNDDESRSTSENFYYNFILENARELSDMEEKAYQLTKEIINLTNLVYDKDLLT